MSIYQNLILDTTFPKPTLTDGIEILIIAVLIYAVLAWVMNSRTKLLMRGIIFIIVIIFLAYVFQMNTILWLVKNASVVAITALIVIFQPELRKALEAIGKNQMIEKILNINLSEPKQEGTLTDRDIGEIVKACYEMGRVKTGALIVITKEDKLHEYDRTGIHIDGVITCQLLQNIFEKNTPLHDGALLIRDGRIAYATCYLPLSDNMTLSKELGTRHRAGVGISEQSDSITIIVSEETGKVSLAIDGRVYRNVDENILRKRLEQLKKEEEKEQDKEKTDKKVLWFKQRRKDEK